MPFREPTSVDDLHAQMTALFGDEPTALRILSASDPGKAKALGRAVRGFDDARWKERCFDIVTAGTVAKHESARYAFRLGMTDHSVARQKLSNGIAELMVCICALGSASVSTFEAHRADAVRAAEALSDVLRENARAWQLDDARYAAALPHTAALVSALRDVTAEAPLSAEVEQAFDTLLRAIGSRPEPSLRSLLAAYRAAGSDSP